MKRPIGVTILAIIAVVLAFLNVIVMLRFLGFLPFLGLINIRIFSLWYALLYGLLAYIWVWLAQMLLHVDSQAWMFLAVITVFNLCLDFVLLVTGVRNAFGTNYKSDTSR